MITLQDVVNQSVAISFTIGKESRGIIRGILQNEDGVWKVRGKDGSYLRFGLDESCIYDEEYNAELAINKFTLGEK